MKFAGRQGGIQISNGILQTQDFNKLLSDSPIYEGEPTDEALRREAKKLTENCPTCDDH